MRALALLIAGLAAIALHAAESPLKAGAAAVELAADDSMVIAGGITAGRAKGQEGKLRCVATVLQKDQTTTAIVACDVLMLTRQTLDPVVAEIEKSTGIPAANILINCTHTHHAPSTMRVHDYGPDTNFTARVQGGIVEAVQAASRKLAPARFSFALGEEKTVGRNSRVLLDDGQIYWIGARTNFVRPTGPFDPELPLLSFRGAARNEPISLIFNHSTHSIGANEPGKRSASIYGMAAQNLEKELGGTVLFLEGASGSTHNLELSGPECISRISASVKETAARLEERPVRTLAARKSALKFRVRHFDEKAEEEMVRRYCRKYAPASADVISEVFCRMRQELAAHQGEERETWVQAIRIGDVAIVGVPAEYFTQLGLDIKNRSPFRHTYIAELANDWIGYLPNFEGHKLGGYQVWTGYHSYAAPGTGERIADEAVRLLKELRE